MNAVEAIVNDTVKNNPSIVTETFLNTAEEL